VSGYVHLLCPACDQRIVLHRHSPEDELLDDVDYDRAYTGLAMHLGYGCALATAAERATARALLRSP
jgi:hypothetical protein